NEAPDSRYWVEHLINKVDFKSAAALLPQNSRLNFVEIGPGASTLVAVNDSLNLTDSLLLRSLNVKKGERTEDYFFYDSFCKLYQSGINIKWDAILEGYAYPNRLPGQKFMHKSYWMAGINAERLSEFANPSTGATVYRNAEKWLDTDIYNLSWKETSAPTQVPLSKELNWILIGESGNLTENL
ncbi:hypothetical protein M8994_22395, partial [Brucella sp. 21LCYQ03]|nr:hypothetical protein [Brucella sp. 21LCYQ03]